MTPNDHTMGATSVSGHEVISNVALSADVHRLVIRAPRVAAVRQPGQFVIVRLGPGAERIPLTIAESDPEEGSIVVVIQAVGKSTSDLVALAAGDRISDIVGPTRQAQRPDHRWYGDLCGRRRRRSGDIPDRPAARRPRRRSGHSSRRAHRRESAYAAEFASFSELSLCTDDGSAGRHGLVTDTLGDLLATRSVDVVYAAGPVPMMRAVAAVTEPFGVRTIVSLNPIMIDGTGMCGGCRVTVDGTMRFACVDGPEFDGHGVDFDELSDRLGTYREAEHEASAHACRSAG